MSVSIGGLYRALQKYPHLDIENLRLIGWGAGQFFNDYYPLINNELKIEFTVCPLESNQGKSMHGVEIKSPDSLYSIKENKLIIIFSNHATLIMNQIRDQYGNIPAISALELNGDIALSRKIDGFWRASEGIVFSQRICAEECEIGIFVQGLIEEYTPQVLAWNKLHNPDVFQCMVTWDHQSKERIELCLPWLDHIELVKEPKNLGPFFFNAILKSCKIGAKAICDRGIKYAVRTRSDQILVGSVHSVIEKYFSRNKNFGKVAIALGFNWQHFPFMFSDRLMVGHADTLLQAWSIDAFEQETQWINFYKNTLNSNWGELRDKVPEVLFWTQVAKNFGYESNTLTDSYNFAKERLLIADPELTVRSIKLTYLFDVKYDNSLSFHHESWNRLLTNFDDAIERASAIQTGNHKVSDFLGKKIG